MPKPGELQFPAAPDTAKTLIEASNNAFTTLTAQLDIGATVAQVADTSRFADSGIWVSDAEIGTYDGKTPTSLLNLTRGEQGTSDVTHLVGATIEVLVTALDHNVHSQAILALQAKVGHGSASFADVLIAVAWGTPAAESGNAIEIAASCLDFAGEPFMSGLVDVQIVVSDAANDSSPSATAAIGPANTPVGSILDGAGTATVIIRTDSNGQFKIKVDEAGAGDRYLWLSPGGHSRLYPRSSTGVQQLTFM